MDTPLDMEGLGDELSKLGIGAVVVHGSRARGDAHRHSDLDLAVLARDGRRLTYGELGAVKLLLDERAERPVDVVDLGTADSLLRMEILRHGRTLFMADRDSWTDFVTRTLIDYDEIAPFVGPCVEGVRRAARRRAAS